MDDNGVIPMDKFAGTPTYNTLNNNHAWGCPFYIPDARLQVTIDFYPSGNRTHVKGYSLITHPSMQDQWI